MGTHITLSWNQLKYIAYFIKSEHLEDSLSTKQRRDRKAFHKILREYNQNEFHYTRIQEHTAAISFSGARLRSMESIYRTQSSAAQEQFLMALE